MLRHQQLQRFNEACLKLYRPGLDQEGFAERSFAFLSSLVPTEMIALGILDTTRQRLEIGFNTQVPSLPRAMEAFGNLMKNYELFNWDPSVQGGKPFCRSDYFSDRAFRHEAIYQEVYQVLGIDNHCAVYIPGGKDEIAFFGLERKGGPDFSTEERCLLELAQTQLSNARELVRTYSQLGSDCHVSPRVLMRAGLTVREAEVLSWLAEGKSNEEIGRLLGLQLYTVKGYVKMVFQKTGTPNRLAAALWALRYCHRQGIVSPEDFINVSTGKGKTA